MARDQLYGTLDIASLKDIQAAMDDLSRTAQGRVRRALLKEFATHMTRAAKGAVKQFRIKPQAKAVLRRAIYRRDPKTRQFTAKGRKRRVRPMRYTVSVRRGAEERAGASVRYASGAKKGQVKGVRKHSRDAFWWYWPEEGTGPRTTKAGSSRGEVKGQHVFRETFSANFQSARRAAETAARKQIDKELAKLATKAAKKARRR